MDVSFDHRERPRRIFVFDSPRTCSNLFRQLFLTHPQLGHILQPFLPPSVFGREGAVDLLECSEAARKVVEDMMLAVPEMRESTYKDANLKLRRDIEGSENEGRIPWIKDHAIYSVKPEIILSTLRSKSSVEDILKSYPNPTLIDEDLLRSFTPIFLIRHPILVVQSYWEVNLTNIGSDVRDEQFEWMISVRWVRILFDFFRERTHDTPLVVDADDVVHRTEEVTDRICDSVGLDRAGISFNWERAGDTGQVGDFFKQRLKASSGVERVAEEPMEKRFDLHGVTARWREKYGDSIGEALRQRVEAEMSDYEYLRRFKLLS